jgi:transcriptional regulator with XRE-family HTH domain
VKINHTKFLPKNLKLLRDYSDESQEAFGDIFGLTRDNIASYERGTEPKLSFLMDVAGHFHIKLDDLVSCDLNSHMDLLDTRDYVEDANAAYNTEQCGKLRREIEELKKDKEILATEVTLKNEQIQRLWKEIDELKGNIKT